MDIKSIETFLRVAELENFTKAAEDLHYAQSSVSKMRSPPSPRRFNSLSGSLAFLSSIASASMSPSRSWAKNSAHTPTTFFTSGFRHACSAARRKK